MRHATNGPGGTATANRTNTAKATHPAFPTAPPGAAPPNETVEPIAAPATPPRHHSDPVPSARGAGPSRRGFLRSAGAAALGAGVYTWRVEPHWLEVVERDLPVTGLPSGLRGARLVQVSDVHIGPIVDSEYVARSLAAIARLEPDLIALTGDFMSCEGTERVDETARVFERLPRPRLGAFAVFGNHDYGHEWSHLEAADRLASRFGDLGIEALRNEVRVVGGGLAIGGVEDLWSPRFDLGRTIAAMPADGSGIVLCHNPDAADKPGWGNFRGWILCGHTHGGQCKPPFLPPPLLPVVNRRYTAGAFDLFDGRRMYINRGLGYLKRVRFNVRPEITLFRLTDAPGPSAA